MKTTTFTYTATLEIDTEMFEDIIETGGEGIGYWAHNAKHDQNAETFTVHYDGTDFDDTTLASGVKTVSYEDLGNAVVKISKGDANAGNWIVEQVNQWLNGHPTMDVDLADVVIQVALFGEIVYG